MPWIALHGGPGSGASPALLATFDGMRHAAWGHTSAAAPRLAVATPGA